MDELRTRSIAEILSKTIDATCILVILALAVPMTYGIVFVLVEDGSVAMISAIAAPFAGPLFIWGIVRWSNTRHAKRPPDAP